MSKNSVPPPYSPPPSAPPSYAQAVGGVPPTSPFIPQHHHTFMKGPTILTTVVPVGPDKTHMICPHCHAEIDTTTNRQPANTAYIAGAVICLMGCFLGCCLIPCCMDKFTNVHHTCPNCHAYLGTYRR